MSPIYHAFLYQRETSSIVLKVKINVYLNLLFHYNMNLNLILKQPFPPNYSLQQSVITKTIVLYTMEKNKKAI